MELQWRDTRKLWKWASLPSVEDQGSWQSNMEAQNLSSNFPYWYKVYQTISLCWHKVYQPNVFVGTWSIRQHPLLTQDLSGNFPSWIELQKKSRRNSVIWLMSNPLHQSVKKHLLCIGPIIHLQKAWKKSFPKFSEVLFIEPIYEKTMFWYVVN